MFEASKFKKLARMQLKGNKVVCAAVTIVFSLLIFFAWMNNFRSGMPSFNFNINGHSFFNRFDAGEIENSVAKSALSLIAFIISGVLAIAVAKFFLTLSRAPFGFRCEFSQFVDGFSDWARGIFGFLWQSLWVSLWALLFVIPGIIKYFEYSQIFFVLADSPSISVPKALKISKVITRGFKGDIFFMCLSFFGWFLLSAMTCGILALWVFPYFHATCANAYNFLKERAIAEGRLLPTDFE